MHMIVGGVSMRTTLDLPEDLLEEAMHLTDTGTKTAVIVLALEELIRRARITDLKKYRGKIPLEIDLDTLRNR
jgi:Arc/MetJ family transcription regulator